MKTCQKCKTIFSTTKVIDGKRRFFSNRKFCLDCSPFGEHNTTKLTGKRPALVDSLSREEFFALVKNSKSRSDIMSKLGLRKASASFLILNRRIEKEGHNTDHFVSGNIGKKKRKIPNEKVFAFPSSIRPESVRARVVSDNLIDYRCAKCGLGDVWNKEKITLELDHIDGNRIDNRLENLRFLCPNCHSQTPTYGRKNRPVGN